MSLFRLIIPLSALALSPLAAQEDDAVYDSNEVVEDMSNFLPQEPERRHGEVPAMFRDDAMLDNSHLNQELGINVYTAPSISKIFTQMDDLPPIPEAYVLRKRPEKLSTNAGSLALEMGYLLADGFIAVRSGHMNDIKPIALDLSRYGKAMGVGEKMNTHSASLLEHAEKGQLEEFKRILSSTQADVNAELISLRDPDLAHLIALGGWVRALDAAAAAIEERFDEKEASVIFYPDAPAYFSEVLQGINPNTAKKLSADKMVALLNELSRHMSLAEGEKASVARVKALHELVGKLSTIAVGAGYER